ncbi:MAG: glycoside hydrolase family 2 [Candidatus Sumerlaeia bacterium]|nr:glycoside hydrolase family 2 [Candidatus Sumerlaeia bacterium]
MTRWGRQVSPQNVHPEYPRPQMVRENWTNLNGLWDYAIVGRDAAAPANYDGKILVPYPLESALSGVMKRLDDQSRLWYRRTFEIPAAWAGQRVLLHFGAVDWEATVLVNGKEVGVHRGGYDAFSFDITDALKPSGAQELVVAVWDPTDKGGQPRGKQVMAPKGIWYTPTSGIWQTVWIEPVPQAGIAGLKMVPDVDGSRLRLTVEGRGADAAGAEIEAVALSEGKEIARASGKAGSELSLPIPNPRLWWPDSPFLYDLKVTMKKGGQSVDTVDSYFGMRKIAVAKDEKGINRLMLNGKFVFQIGPLDQGFWPDGLYTAPTDAALRYDIEMTKKFGMNMARKHVKIEPARWYYWCDKLGLLVWQDMPSTGKKNEQDKKQFETELKAMIETHYNHPSIIMWVVFNEGWGQYDTERLTAWVKEMDPSRLVNNASGWTDMKCGDVIDMHKYPGPGSPDPEPTRAAVLGEFGGLGLAVEGHTWTKEWWGYRGMADKDALTRQYVRLLGKVWALKDSPGLSAAVYTQTTDVEVECNGLMTYDRALVKPDLEKIVAANRGEIPPEPQPRVVVPCALDDRVFWRLTFDKPADDWFKPEFDDSTWKEARAGFGTKETPGAVVRTEWKTPNIWLRREFTLSEPLPKVVLLQMHHDEDVEVYINGALAYKASGFTTDYDLFELTREGRAALKAGKNILAVHCRQTKGGQYIDVGLVEPVDAAK